MDIEDALQLFIDNRNFKPGKKYALYTITEIDGKNGGTLLNKQKYRPRRNLYLPRDPVKGTSIYDLKDQDDFEHYFEKQFGNLPNGVYAAMTSRGGNDGWAWLFKLRLENGEVDKWWKKSQPENTRQNSSTYYGFPYYFNLREELGV